MTLLISRKTDTHRELYVDKRITTYGGRLIHTEKANKIYDGDNFLVANCGYAGFHVIFEMIDRMISSANTQKKGEKASKDLLFLDFFSKFNSSVEYRCLDALIPIDSTILDSEASLTYVINEFSRSFRQNELRELEQNESVGGSIIIPKTNNKVFWADLYSSGVFLEERHDDYYFDGCGATMARALVTYQRDVLKIESDIQSVFDVVSRLDGGVGSEIDFYIIDNV